MRKTVARFALLIALVNPGLTLACGQTASGDAAQDVLVAYEALARALVGDDLAGARRESTRLAEIARTAGQDQIARHAVELTSSDSLDSAREHFKAISAETIRLVEGREGYYVMTCPMVQADWVQSSKQVANPYMGQKMVSCGTIKQPRES